MTAQLFVGGRELDMPLRRAGTPDDIANLYLFLASEQSSWISGAEICVDGGKSAGPTRISD